MAFTAGTGLFDNMNLHGVDVETQRWLLWHAPHLCMSVSSLVSVLSYSLVNHDVCCYYQVLY